jgi:hypothetical protein
MTHRIVDPRFMKVQEWADSLCLDLSEYAVIPQLSDPDRWQDWASGLVTVNGISQLNPPSPYQFDDWQEWAYRFYQVLD